MNWDLKIRAVMYGTCSTDAPCLSGLDSKDEKFEVAEPESPPHFRPSEDVVVFPEEPQSRRK